MIVIVGALIVLASVTIGYLMHGGHLLVLNQPSEFIIIGGAALGSLLISTPVRVLKLLLAQLKGIFGKGLTKADYVELLSMLYQLFKLIQHSGVMALESHIEDPKASPVFSRHPSFMARHHSVDFLTDSLKVIMMGGIAPHDLESLMEEDLQIHHEETARPATTLNKVSDALPGLGIVAAVLGVVITMQAIDGPPAEIGHKVAAALVGTFLGVLLCYGFVGPLAANIEQTVTDEGRYDVCVKTGLLAIYKGFPPAIAVEFARRVLPDDVRPTFDETEKVCRSTSAQQRADMQQAA